MTTITIDVLDRFQAAKRYGLDCWALDDAVRAGRVPRVEHDGWEPIATISDIEAWLSSLTPRERVLVYPCTRKGCACAQDKYSHVESHLAEDGTVMHGCLVADSHPCWPGGRLKSDREATGWQVRLQAIGDGPWEVEVTTTTDMELAREAIDQQEGQYTMTQPLPLPRPNDLVAAIAKAQRKADKLNRGRQ